MEKAGVIRYTAKPAEISLVDAPCIPGATFQIMKAQSIEHGKFKEGTGVARMVLVLQDDDLEKMDTTPVPTPTPDTGNPVEGNAIGGPNAVNTPMLFKEPEPSSTLEIPSNTNVPSTEQLAQAAVKSKELQDMVSSVISQFNTSLQKVSDELPITVRKIIREELYKAIGEEETRETKNDQVSAKKLITVVRS
jgi:hypothetical protein